MAVNELQENNRQIGILSFNLLFWLIMAILCLRTLEIGYQISANDVIKKDKQPFLDFLRECRSLRDWERLLRVQFRFFSQDAYWSSDPVSFFRSGLNSFKSTIPGEVEFLLFDKYAKVIASTTSVEIKPVDATNLFHDLECLEEGFPDVLKKNVPRYDYFFKGSLPRDGIFLDTHFDFGGDVIPLRGEGPFGSVFISQFFKNGLLLGFLKKNLAKNDLLLETNLKNSLQKIRSDIFVEVIDPYNFSTESFPFNVSRELRELLKGKIEDVSPVTLACGGYITGIIGLKDRRILVGQKNSELEELSSKHLKWEALLIMFFLLVFFWTTRTIRNFDSKSPDGSRKFIFGIGFVLQLILFGSPFFMLRIYCQDVLKDELDGARIEVENECWGKVASIETMMKPEDLLRNRLTLLSEQCLIAGKQVEWLRTDLKELSHEVSGVFQMALFDSNGALLEEASDLKIAPDKAALFIQSIKKLKNKQFREIRDNDFFPLEMMRDYPLDGKPFKERDLGKDGSIYKNPKNPDFDMLFVSTLFDRGLIIVRCKMDQGWKWAIASQFKYLWNFWDPNCFCDEVDSQKLVHLISPGFFSGSSEKKEYLDFLCDDHQDKKLIGNCLFQKRFYQERFWFIYGKESFNVAFLKKFSEMLDVILLVFFFIVCRFMLKVGHSGHTNTLRDQLINLLGLITLILVFFMFFNFRERLDERRKFLETGIINEQRKNLEEIDRMFFEEIRIFETQIKRLLNVEAKSDFELEKTLKDRLQEIFQKYSPTMVELFGQNGKSIFSKGSGEEALINKTFRLMVKSMEKLIAELNNEALKEKSDFKGEMVSVVGETYGLNLEYIFSLFSQNLDQLKIFKFFDSQVIAILNSIRNETGKIHHLVLLAWVPESVEEKYLARVLKKLTGVGASFDMYARTKFGRKIFTSIPWLEKDPRLPPFFWKRNIEIPESQIIEFPYAKYFFTRIPFNQMKYNTLGLISSDIGIRNEISRLQENFRNLILGIIGALLVAWMIIKKIFLEPFYDLKFGIAALQNRDFSYRVRDLGKDEFGELASAFNMMLESIQDLEIARTLQENIFPEKPLEKNGWIFYGKCKPTTEVGGDYFDYLEIDEKRVLFVLGDVTGHGIPAALVVGMAKAAVFHTSNLYKPEIILDHLGVIITTVLKKKRMMTCMIGIFDTSNGLLTLSNAGQCFPYIIDGKKAEEFKVPGVPLGAKTRGYKSVTRTLCNEEWLLGYSDGFVETRNTFGEMVGYEKMAEMLPGMKKPSAWETMNNLFLWNESIACGRKQDDDITLLVVCRKII
ncbi:MAG: SpoIIE family protein phosphatase [Candidatus Riflebacteria bacterium]|nr:SpoIIE family protein phosphatase [Candidatus Riflebacteria bacterium]